MAFLGGDAVDMYAGSTLMGAPKVFDGMAITLVLSHLTSPPREQNHLPEHRG